VGVFQDAVTKSKKEITIKIGEDGYDSLQKNLDTMAKE